LVVHSNHGNEINTEVKNALRKLSSGKITLLNQAVLLAGINDTEDELADLSEQLFTAGVLPYYLHLLDRVRGAAHFEVTARRGLELITQLENRLPGYLVPRLVREDAGEPAKARVTAAP
jgi:L-lysine 2,3-aminomutase